VTAGRAAAAAAVVKGAAAAAVACWALALGGCQRRAAPEAGAGPAAGGAREAPRAAGEAREAPRAAGEAREAPRAAGEAREAPRAAGGAGGARVAGAGSSGAPPAGANEAAGLTYVERQAGGGPDEVLPMVVAVHGLGDTPENLGDALVAELGRPARVILPRGPKPHGGGYSWFDLSASNEAMLAGIERATALVAGGVGEIVKRRPTRGKPIVLGFSQGGMITFALAARHPSLVGAAFPVAGFLPPPLDPPRGAALPPLVAFHGAEDRVVPAQLARASVDRLRSLGVRAEIHVYDGLGHSISNELRGDLRREVAGAMAALGH
jgi:phospholipase/carboxylesterase